MYTPYIERQKWLKWQRPLARVGPHLTRDSLGPSEPITKTPSRSVQPFFAGLTSVTDGQTDHATWSVAIGRIYVRSSGMRPKRHALISARRKQCENNRSFLVLVDPLTACNGWEAA